MVVLGKANLSEWANIRDERLDVRLERVRRPDPQPVRPEPVRRRVELGQRRRGGGRHHAVRRGHRDRRVDLLPGGVQRLRRAQADGRAGADRRGGADLPSQDSPGPMATTVRDAAALLGVLAGNGTDYASYAVDGRLAGKRIGVPRASVLGLQQPRRRARRARRPAAGGRGATIVDATDLEPMEDFDGQDELLVMLAELRSRAWRRYLAGRPGDGPRSPGRRGRLEPRARRHRARSTSASPCSSRRWRDRASTAGSTPRHGPRCLRAGRDDGIDAVLRAHDLDALVTPSYGPGGPIDLVNPEAPRRLLHPADGDRRLPAAHRPAGWRPACRSPSPSGVRRPASRPWSRSPRATRRPGTGTPGRCRRRPSRRSSEPPATASASPRW